MASVTSWLKKELHSTEQLAKWCRPKKVEARGLGQRTEMPTPETVRGFWHGSPLNPYQLLSLRSFVDRGHSVEVFTYDRAISVPSWIVRRDASEIWPTDRVLHYQTEPGRGSPALHANLFRYAMLYKLGGWWIDLDVILLQSALPLDEYYFAVENTPHFNIAVLKFPRGHPLLSEAIDRCAKAGERKPIFGETGPLLFTELVIKYGLFKFAQPAAAVYPLLGAEFAMLFDADRREALTDRCTRATFIHLYNEVWRRSGIPGYLGPPAGSFLEALFAQHPVEAEFVARMEFDHVRRWTAFLHLHEEFQTGLRAYRSAMQELESENEALLKISRCSQQHRKSSAALNLDQIKKYVRKVFRPH